MEAVDELTLILASHRLSLALGVGAYKLATNQPIYRGEKEGERIDKVKALAIKLGLNPNFAAALLYLIIDESCKQQMIQLQAHYDPPVDTTDDDQWRGILKENLLKLTARVASTYDDQYSSDFFASRVYGDFENAVIVQEIKKLSNPELFIDLGCGTGIQTLKFAPAFPQSIGYDLSPHMIEWANNKLIDNTVSFIQTDLEKDIPLPSSSASFVIMNLGTASDIPTIEKLIEEISRVLAPEGRFFLSFYNRDALVYQWDFLPWPVSLAAQINHEKGCLDVRGRAETFSVHARAYSPEEINSFFPEGLSIERMLTYPTLSPILPNFLFRDPSVAQTVLRLEQELSTSGLGAYAIVTGKKRGADAE